MKESEYYQGVVDCCKLLIQEQTNNQENFQPDINSTNEEIYLHLEKIELELENRVPRISPLYSALKIDKGQTTSQSL